MWWLYSVFALLNATKIVKNIGNIATLHVFFHKKDYISCPLKKMHLAKGWSISPNGGGIA